MSSVNFNNVVGSVQRHQQQQEREFENNVLQERLAKPSIQVSNFLPFPSLFEVMYTDTEEFPTIINALLRPLFVDFYGSKVEIVQNRQLYTTIFFTENPQYVNCIRENH